MKIAVIGTGNVGGTLGSRWAQGGHAVIFGTRDPASEKVKALLESAGENARTASVSEAAAAAEIVALTTPWAAAKTAIESAGDLAGKVVVDCTNPIAEGLSGLAIGHTTSAAEQIAEWAKGARVVKAFNTTGANNMADPTYGSQQVTMFICGDDPDAKRSVAQLAEELGFDVCDTGALQTARYLEPLALLWIHLVYKQGFGREFAFKILKR